MGKLGLAIKVAELGPNKASERPKKAERQRDATFVLFVRNG